MTYGILGQNLWETADLAKQYFAEHYGAKSFKCEQEIDPTLPLKPTWQAQMAGHYRLCIEVRETPFSMSLYEFVAECSKAQEPVRLWVAVPDGADGPNFGTELKKARDVGIGVVKLSADGTANVFHQPVALSLFGLRCLTPKDVPKDLREAIKGAENLFLGGSPDKGCQEICQHLELLTRQFAEYTYKNSMWKNGSPTGLRTRFFSVDSWAKMLEALDTHVSDASVKKRCPLFSKAKVAAARGFTDWRNDVSHRPKDLKELRVRDGNLRSMFEVTRQLLIDWYLIAKPLKLS